MLMNSSPESQDGPKKPHPSQELSHPDNHYVKFMSSTKEWTERHPEMRKLMIDSLEKGAHVAPEQFLPASHGPEQGRMVVIHKTIPMKKRLKKTDYKKRNIFPKSHPPCLQPILCKSSSSTVVPASIKTPKRHSLHLTRTEREKEILQLLDPQNIFADPPMPHIFRRPDFRPLLATRSSIVGPTRIAPRPRTDQTNITPPRAIIESHPTPRPLSHSLQLPPLPPLLPDMPTLSVPSQPRLHPSEMLPFPVPPEFWCYLARAAEKDSIETTSTSKDDIVDAASILSSFKK